MKKIGIIFAMYEELNSFLENIKVTNMDKVYELDFYETIINNNTCILVESGVGKVNASRTTQILIDKYNVDYVFNVGVAGGVDEKLNVGDVVIGNKLIQHDFDITAFNHNKGYIPKVGDEINSDNDLITLALQSSKELETIRTHVGVIASGDIFVTEEKMSKKINQKFAALAVEMEGASVAHVCFLDKVPCLILRSISDVPNNNNVITYEEFLKDSCDKISKLMLKIVEKIN